MHTHCWTLHGFPFVLPQAPRSSCVQCNCRVNPSCVMCGGWPTPREDPQYELPTLERLSRLDLGVHPILSFPDGQCSVYAGISYFTSGEEDKQGVASHRQEVLQKHFSAIWTISSSCNGCHVPLNKCCFLSGWVLLPFSDSLMSF